MNELTSALLPEMMEVWQETLAWQPDISQQAKFQLLYQLIVQGNRQLNLTRISEPVDFWEKHLWDSLRGIFPVFKDEVRDNFKVIDIGTGGGFPGVPVAIVKPNWQITLLDSTRKKLVFLDGVLSNLNLENAHTLVGRAEEVGQEIEHRHSYNLALIRAVGPAQVCAEYALPLVKTGGSVVLYRGHWSEEETISLTGAVAKLGGEISSIEAFVTPVSQSVRHCIYLRKIAKTPVIYPRAVGLPGQQPLS